MGNTSRDLRDKVVRALAKVGLVWAIAVLAALFMTMSAQGRTGQTEAPSSAGHADPHASFVVASDHAPSTAGLALALGVLGAGVVVLSVGATRGHREPRPDVVDEPDLGPGQPLAVGPGLLA